MPTTYTNRTDRFSGNCDHCDFPVVVELPDTFGDYHRRNCPSCSTPVRLERLYGTFSDMNCDARCQYALGNSCSCACGGANHRAGYIPPVQTGVLPASIVDRARNAARAARERAQRGAATRATNRAAAKAAQMAAFMASAPAVAEAFALAEANAFAEVHPYAQRTIADIARRFSETGAISGRQAEFVITLKAEADSRAETAARIAAERATEVRVNAPAGRTTIEGVVVSRKGRDTDYGYVYKLTIKCETAGGIFLVWVTEPPSAVQVSRGDVVKLTATLTPSDRDPAFAFGKRPTNFLTIGRLAQTTIDSLDDPEA